VVAAALSRTGRACAQALAKEGARVAILSRRQEELDKVAKEIGAETWPWPAIWRWASDIDARHPRKVKANSVPCRSW